jgi:hypothetical protein
MFDNRHEMLKKKERKKERKKRMKEERDLKIK